MRFVQREKRGAVHAKREAGLRRGERDKEMGAEGWFEKGAERVFEGNLCCRGVQT
jgi:hypothetical protein